MTRPPCRATHADLTCCRTDNGSETYRIPHPAPHMAADGTQWDEHGVCVKPGRNAYREEGK